MRTIYIASVVFILIFSTHVFSQPNVTKAATTTSTTTSTIEHDLEKIKTTNTTTSEVDKNKLFSSERIVIGLIILILLLLGVYVLHKRKKGEKHE